MTDLKTIITMYKQLCFIIQKEQKKKFVLMFITLFIGAGFELLGVTAIIPFVQAVITPHNLMEKWYIAPVVSGFNIDNPNTVILLVGIVIMFVYLIKNIYLSISNFIYAKFRYDFKKILSIRVLKANTFKPYAFFLETNTAKIMHSIDHDVPGVCSIVEYLSLFLKEALTSLVIGFFIFYTDFYMAMGVVFLAGLSLVVTTLGFKKKLSNMGAEQRNAEIAGSKCAYQFVAGNKEIRVMKRSDYFVGMYEKTAEIMRKTSIGNAFVSGLPERIIETVCISGIIGVVCGRVNMGIDVENFVPKLGVFAVAAFRILPSVSRMTGYINQIVFHRLNLETTFINIMEGENLREKNTKINSNLLISFNEKIEIKDIVWRYLNSSQDVIKNLSLTIIKGEAIAFIGKSGAGKTTLADVILGLLLPTKGTIKMDGVEIESISEEWSKIVGYVPQSVFLLDDTIKNNIAFGVNNTEINEELVWDALGKAQLKNFVQNLTDGIYTCVGERGVKLSGGQRQRIAIARALYHNPDILVLDEATAALDTETESAVMEAVDALHGYKTLIIIAHRLTTIRKCDKIYEISNGKIWLRDKESLV